MSAPGMMHDPNEIRSGGTKIGRAGDDLHHAVDTLDAALRAQGDCWGNDEAGQKFAQQYVPGHAEVLNGLRQLSDKLHEINNNLQQTANDVEQREHQQGGHFGDMRSQMGH